MIMPIRCFSCGKVLGGLYEEFKERTQKGEDAGKVLDDLGVKKYCCRKMILTHAETIDDIMKFNK
ncbi:MAG: DNA-directed RNA polymerase subunit N [Candidatus ainarchaeum sp.]|jgi:DNA-directed RNA polymerase subunit N|nr:DNA-directed RNA polymerase subunit N [Candidatus ainarchaeum sp.]MDD3085741.1 DNA-directed RNA polymerase subunit N [Candidatus ainarchaeum sp.]MDD4128474.1 DNA-directed RNA polymerase subunit N [Candidatus ainarchaeum sp.]MDD4467877.1 DNA-directed RNA polymerase subunit N [Candidatus ainarchaeum sp.]HPM85529.1 DNA-directed RNA polymerase subunit N [archaeon]